MRQAIVEISMREILVGCEMLALLKIKKKLLKITILNIELNEIPSSSISISGYLHRSLTSIYLLFHLDPSEERRFYRFGRSRL